MTETDSLLFFIEIFYYPFFKKFELVHDSRFKIIELFIKVEERWGKFFIFFFILFGKEIFTEYFFRN
jgi:hypothetical protein